MSWVLGMTEEEHRAADLALRREQLAVHRAEKTWIAVTALATAILPLVTILGLEKIIGERR